MQKAPRHPSEVIQDLLTARRMRIKDLARALDGDPLINRVKLQIYLHDPHHQILLGGMTASQLDQVFKKRPDFFRKLERDWLDYRKKLAELVKL